MPARIRRGVAATSIALVLAVSACVTWKSEPVPAPPAAFRSTHGPVHVWLADHSELYLVNVVIATDSLFGTSADVAALHHSVPLVDVVRMEEQKKSPGRSLLLLAAAIVLAITF